MRHPSLVPLSHDHHHGLALALRCRKQSLGQIRPMGQQGLRERAREFGEFYSHTLVKHFQAEEEILFPVLISLVPESGPIIEQLKKDHDQIRAANSQLAADSGLGKILFDLGDILERHIRKEERELFPLLEKRVSVHEAEGVGEGIKKILEAQQE